MPKKKKNSTAEFQPTGSETKMNLKLVIDKSTKTVLFAEAGKEFVDLIFNLLSLPLATVVKLLNPQNMVGCLGHLFKSAESLNPQYFQSEHSKDFLLNPKIGLNAPLLLLDGAPTAAHIPRKLYRCRRCGAFATDVEGLMCPGCGYNLDYELQHVDDGGGSVKGIVTYMVMDNLQVKPIVSTIFRINDDASLVELDVQVGFKEGLAILKASLETKAVLTSVFLQKMI